MQEGYPEHAASSTQIPMASTAVYRLNWQSSMERDMTSRSVLQCLLSTLITLFLSSVIGAVAWAQEVHVAVAANFSQPMTLLAAAFEKKTGHHAILSQGSTGSLYAQITHGAPYEVFLAADESVPARVVNDGLAQAGQVFVYAIGRLALWSSAPQRVDPQGAVLAREDFKHLAIANPKTAPYGAAAMSVLKNLGLLESLKDRLVEGESITQTFQFVSTGNAELGFVALSQIQQDEQPVAGSFWLVPESLHAPIRQAAVLLKQGEKNEAARSLVNYLQSDEARAIIRRFGYAF